MSAASRATTEPREQGTLEVSDGHILHWEAWGAPRGRPAVVPRAWEGSELIVIGEEGHRGGPTMRGALLAATRRLAAAS